jgi:D-alanine-D-alanine ligase
MKITVLSGGPGDEREISLISGKSVAAGLRESGHDVFVSDIGPDDLSALDRPADVIFPVLHGQFGESGELQQEMESRDLVFVGSGSAASRLGMNKALTKQRWTEAGLTSPQGLLLTSGNRAAIDSFPLPCIVKPVDSGSSVGVHRCLTRDEARLAVADLIEARGSALVERFIAGTELTVGIFEDRALPPIRIVTDHEIFDFEAKYRSNSTAHLFDTGLSDAVIARCLKDATRAYHLIGCVDLSRVDMIVDSAGTPWLLEINTMPGFTPKSLLPEAAGKTGVDFAQVVDRLAKRAYARGLARRSLGKAV